MIFLFLLLVLYGSAFGIDERVEKRLQAHMEEQNIPGLAAVVVTDGQATIYTYGWADRERRKPVDRHTIFNLASVTKVFLTSAVAVEVLERHMSLNEPARDFIPGLREVNGFGRVRIVDLATHTASLPREPPFKPNRGMYRPRDILHFLQNWRPSYPVGTKYVYSNLSFGILGMTLKGVTHHPLQQVLFETLLGPLGMRETAFEVPPQFHEKRAIGYLKNGQRALHFQPNRWPDGGSLNASAADMQMFLLANMGLQGPPELVQALEFAQKGYFKANDRLTLGLAWETVKEQGSTLIDKDGGVAGYASYIGFTQDKRVGLVLLTNKGHAHLPPFGRKLLQMLAN
jgi:beta-lactamase class C